MQHRARPPPLLVREGSASPRSSFKHASDQEAGWRPVLILAAITIATSLAVYFALSPFFVASSSVLSQTDLHETHVSQCCRGVPHQELWGRVVRAGSGHSFDSPVLCCNACKAMCSDDGPCLCNSWVFCSDEKKCGDKFGECWLKMQDTPLSPDVHDSSPNSMWTSGLIYGKDVGIIALETEYGSVRIKLLPECAPKSVAYVRELLKSRRCVGSHYYRAEGRGDLWDEAGNRANQSVRGPPYALLQGVLEGQCATFERIGKEACPAVERGAVGWIGSGPDFFVSLANHDEWYPKYTVFARVLPADMPLVEKLAGLPTVAEVWEGVSVSALNKSVNIRLKRV